MKRFSSRRSVIPAVYSYLLIALLADRPAPRDKRLIFDSSSRRHVSVFFLNPRHISILWSPVNVRVNAESFVITYRVAVYNFHSDLAPALNVVARLYPTLVARRRRFLVRHTSCSIGFSGRRRRSEDDFAFVTETSLNHSGNINLFHMNFRSAERPRSSRTVSFDSVSGTR